MKTYLSGGFVCICIRTTMSLGNIRRITTLCIVSWAFLAAPGHHYKGKNYDTACSAVKVKIWSGI